MASKTTSKPPEKESAPSLKSFKIPKKAATQETSKNASAPLTLSKNDNEEEAVSLTKNYKIPRKDKELKNILQEIQFNSREFSQDIYPIIKQNYYLRNESERNFHYIHGYLVQNPELSSKMETRKKEMKNSKIYTDKDLAVSYAFLEVLSIAEAENICKKGLQCGHRSFGCLGQPNLGVYLSRYSDILTAAPLTSGVSGTFIVFKIIKGRVKLVPAVQSGHLEPTPNYDCHIAKYGPNDLVNASPSRLFEALQIYLYEYEDTELATQIRQICPIAVLTYDYGSPTARSKDQLLWTGTITCGQDSLPPSLTIPRVQLLSQYGKMKPFSLGKILQIKKITTYSCITQWPPIQELRTEQLQSALFRRRELRLNNGLFVSVFRFCNDRADAFIKFVKQLSDNNLIALSTLRGGTFMVIFPLGEFSDQIGIPRYCDTFLSLHCLVFAYRSCVAGVGFGKDPYDPPIMPATVPAAYRVNPIRLELLSISVQPGPEPSPKENSPQPEKEKIDTKNIPDKIEAECFTNQQHQSPGNILTTSALAASSPNLAAVARDPRIARKASQAAALVAEKRPLLEIPRTVVQLDMDLCSPDSPEAQESSQLSPLSLARHGGVSASDLSFITIEDTPSSPGPQDVDERSDIYRPPVIVPLETIKTPVESVIRKRSIPSARSAFAWSEARKKALDEVVLRAPAVSLSNAEKAIISLASLRLPTTLACTNPRHISEQRATTSTDDQESSDKLVIFEKSANAHFFATNEPVSFPKIIPMEIESDIPKNFSDTIFMEHDVEPEPSREHTKGVLIPDDLIFLKTPADEAAIILQTFQSLKESGTCEWFMKVHSQMVLKLADSKKNLDPHSVAHERVTKLLVLLTRYRSLGIVELLSKHECDVRSRAAKDYLPCVMKIKDENPAARCVFLSNLSPDSDGAKEFIKAGISVMNVSTFIERFLKE